MAAKQAADYSQIPSYQTAKEEANLKNEVGLESLLDQEIVILDWTPDSRILPQTRQRTQGFTVKGSYVKDGDEFEVFIGASVLVRELTALRPPFRTVIHLVGQTYRFS